MGSQEKAVAVAARRPVWVFVGPALLIVGIIAAGVVGVGSRRSERKHSITRPAAPQIVRSAPVEAAAPPESAHLAPTISYFPPSSASAPPALPPDQGRATPREQQRRRAPSAAVLEALKRHESEQRAGLDGQALLKRERFDKAVGTIKGLYATVEDIRRPGASPVLPPP
jgi:hypothetical protein